MFLVLVFHFDFPAHVFFERAVNYILHGEFFDM